jgi:hypothetical protein
MVSEVAVVISFCFVLGLDSYLDAAEFLTSQEEEGGGVH